MVQEKIKGNILRTAKGCWEWLGGQDRDGYGTMWIGQRPKRKKKFVHRVSYEAFEEPISDELEIDHLCRNKICCNPSHLEVVTTQENTRRRDVALQRDKYCRNGHERSPSNTYLSKQGVKSCRVCRKAATKKWRSKQGV